MTQALDQQLEKIRQLLSDKIIEITADRVGCPIIWSSSSNVIALLTGLKSSEGLEFEFLSDLTAYDELGSADESKSRFVVVYNLFSPAYKTRARVKVRLNENEMIPTAIGVWASANWAEREVYDMFGIKFDGHPDLRRILMDARWEGHPLRKDYYWRKYQIFSEPEEIPMHLLKD